MATESLIKCIVMSAYTLWTVHGMYRTMVPKTGARP